MSLDAVSTNPAVAAPDPAPQAPEGADLQVTATPHDASFWDLHPDVETYKVVMPAGAADLEEWTVLVWLKPQGGQEPPVVAANRDVPTRPSDATFTIHAAHDQEFFGRHPGVEAWKLDLQLNEAGPGSSHKIQVWMAPSVE